MRQSKRNIFQNCQKKEDWVSAIKHISSALQGICLLKVKRTRLKLKNKILKRHLYCASDNTVKYKWCMHLDRKQQQQLKARHDCQIMMCIHHKSKNTNAAKHGMFPKWNKSKVAVGHRTWKLYTSYIMMTLHQRPICKNERLQPWWP